MSKIITILLLVSVVCTATVTALAASQEPTLNAVNSLEITKVAANTAVVKNTSVIGNSNTQYSVSQDKKTSESSLPTTGWLLLSALIGFVLLSNRWSV
ncbi:MAG: hypothetical protein ABIP37_06235 [Methylotenera sp.]